MAVIGSTTSDYVERLAGNVLRIALELRINVADYDAHDDVARLSASQRQHRRRAQDEFVAQLRETHRS